MVNPRTVFPDDPSDGQYFDRLSTPTLRERFLLLYNTTRQNEAVRKVSVLTYVLVELYDIHLHLW